MDWALFLSSSVSSVCASSSGAHLEQILLELVSQAVQEWLGFSGKKSFQPQAWFAQQVITCFTEYALLLPQVWAAACNLRLEVLTHSHSRDKSICQSDLQSVAIAMKTHPLAMDNSQERNMIKAMGRLISTFLHIILLPRNSVEPGCSPSTSKSIGANPNLSWASPLGGMPQRLGNMLECMLPLLSNASTFGPGSEASSRSTDSGDPWLSICAKIAKNPDKYLPFRQCVPGLTRMLAENGPLGHHYLKTAEGLASELIFRGITFGTPCSLQKNCVFKFKEDWPNMVVDMKTEGKSFAYYCDKSCYGRTIACKDFEDGKIYWEKAHDPHFNYWLLQPKSADFTTVFKLLQDLPNIGPLTAYLICSDYGLAGLLSMVHLGSDTATMASIIRMLKASSL
ncbi:hypothetical protein BJ138DRAFT_1118604 [Hygrophoropsis aurantiaca]|uniref:Uncharacterized protein n=1 Tax=Hygrophoropsis aurantiaca TaxID=72124 RepID=A0ACB7ZY67_9AGAM|nr:hypothetical protein BJ138DRAFT_1118604 [Hygrophoropsis aurantiaca]